MPISAANISSQEISFSVTVNGRIWRWKTSMDVSGAAPRFFVKDVMTPFGVLTDQIPLPGEVVEGMGESIEALRTHFKPTILIGPPSSLTFEVDEGRGLSIPLTVILTNTGVYGSVLSGTLSVSAPYVHVTPTVVGNLASNESGYFDVAVDSTDLLASSSPYSATVTIQDGNATNTPQTLPLTINVRPKAVVGATPGTLTFNVTRPISGSFPPISSQQFTVENTGPANSLLEFQIVRLTNLSQDWLVSFTPVSGSLTSGAQQTISVLVDPKEGMLPGTYQETLRISGYSVNGFVDVLIRLVIV